MPNLNYKNAIKLFLKKSRDRYRNYMPEAANGKVDPPEKQWCRELNVGLWATTHPFYNLMLKVLCDDF